MIFLNFLKKKKKKKKKKYIYIYFFNQHTKISDNIDNSEGSKLLFLIIKYFKVGLFIKPLEKA